MHQIKQKLNPNPERHADREPDSAYDNTQSGNWQGQPGQTQGQGPQSAPGPAVQSQRNFDDGRNDQGGIDASQQGGSAVTSQSQGPYSGQHYDMTNVPGVPGGPSTTGAHDDGGQLQGVERREEVVGGGQGGAGNQQGGGWDGGMGVTGGSAPGDGSRQNIGTGTGHHPARRAAEPCAAAGAAHHARDDGRHGLQHNDEERQLERDFVGPDGGRSGAGGAGTQQQQRYPDGSFDRHGVSYVPAQQNLGGGDVAGMHPTAGAGVGQAAGYAAGYGTGAGVGPDARRDDRVGVEGQPGVGVGAGQGAGQRVGHAIGQGDGAGTAAGLNYVTDTSTVGQAPGPHPAAAAGVGAGQPRPGYNVPPEPGTGTSQATGPTGTGTSSVITGKLQQAAGMILSNDTMRAKGLDKEAKGEAQRNVVQAQRLEQEAAALRERAAPRSV